MAVGGRGVCLAASAAARCVHDAKSGGGACTCLSAQAAGVGGFHASTQACACVECCIACASGPPDVSAGSFVRLATCNGSAGVAAYMDTVVTQSVSGSNVASTWLCCAARQNRCSALLPCPSQVGRDAAPTPMHAHTNTVPGLRGTRRHGLHPLQQASGRCGALCAA